MALRGDVAKRLRLAMCGIVGASVLLFALLGAAPAFAGAQWRLSARAAPTQLPLNGEGFINVQAINSGDLAISARVTPVTITDTLPEGITATAVSSRREDVLELEEGGVFEGKSIKAPWTCSKPNPRTVTCTYDSKEIPTVFYKPIAPYGDLELNINVKVSNPAGSLDNTVTVEGGREQDVNGVEATSPLPSASAPPRPFAVSGLPTPFGLEEKGYTLTPENEAGLPETLAGAHPFQLTTTLAFNETLEAKEVEGETRIGPGAPAPVRNLHFNLPPGLLGNVKDIPRCSELQFGTLDANGGTNACPDDTALGVIRVVSDAPEEFNYLFQTFTAPVFNLTPKPGEPARFGFLVYHVPVTLDTHVRTGDNGGAPGAGDYGVEVSTSNVTQLTQLLASEVTFWGVPGDASHDQSRGWACVFGGYWVRGTGRTCTFPTSHTAKPFLMLPTACEGPLTTTVDGVSWPIKAPGENGLGKPFSLEGRFDLPAAFEGCGALPFSPSIELKPTSAEASTPTGLEVDVQVPQDTTLDANGRAESAVKATTVTLPEGVQLSPSAANGLEACSRDQIGYQGEGKTDPFSPNTTEPLRFSPEEASCPTGSKVGTVKVETPLLKNSLEGSVYLAEQENNPFGSLIALYIVAEDPPSVVEKGEASGIRVKIAGEVKLNPDTGQITSTFSNTPQVPFADFRVNFNSGPRASVSTPPLCGDYTTGASFTAWADGRVVSSSSPAGEFAIGSGPGGGACSNPQPFSPSFTAGSTNLQAGAFTPFTLTINRPDTDQALKSVSVTLPPGAAAMLKSATQCPEPQANQGTCGDDSLIGHATAVSGLGDTPFTVTGGRVYITGPYNGAPFGLSIVTRAKAPPFDLGNVIVRSGIYVDRTTAAVTINSTLPTMVSSAEHPNTGIPLQLKSVNVVVDRPNFEFNPTNCTPMSVTGTLGGANGASHAVSAPFQVANCSALPFHPKLTASTQGNASKANGASLTVKVEATPGQANIAKTRLVLPIALPSRLTTIQKACLAAVFEANPAACPEGSNIGTATVHTPVLNSVLRGPAYLVSHGNAAFPDVEFVLQGEGITLILDGQTDIKKGITTSTFNAVPDAPVTTFETTLPEGPHSALTSNVPESKHFSLCGTKLVMPTTITGQNGAVIQQETKIPVTGCKKSGVLGTRAQKLKNALKACQKKFKHNKKKRVACEKKARKKYGSKKAKAKTKAKAKARHKK